MVALLSRSLRKFRGRAGQLRKDTWRGSQQRVMIHSNTMSLLPHDERLFPTI
jgi:hypothetical protein